MHLRSMFVSAMTALVVAATAAPAWAHEEINPKTFPTGQPTFLTLTAANEASVDLVRIVLRAPAGLAFGEATRSPAGWSAASTDDTITWSGGAVKHDNFETWGFEIEGADQPGTLTYKVTLAYAGGKTDDVDVDVTATAPGTGAGTASPATTVTTGATATSTSPTTAAAAPADSGGGSDSDSGPAKAALAVSIVALLVAAGALAVGARRSGGGPGPNRASGGGTAPGAAQDW